MWQPQFTATKPSIQHPSLVQRIRKALPTHLQRGRGAGIWGDPSQVPEIRRAESGCCSGAQKGDSDRNSPRPGPANQRWGGAGGPDSPPTQHQMRSGPRRPPQLGTRPEWGHPREVTSSGPLPSDRGSAGSGLRSIPPGVSPPPIPSPFCPGISGPSPSDVTGVTMATGRSSQIKLPRAG